MSAPGGTRRGPAALRKRRRLYIVLAGMTMLSLAIGLFLYGVRGGIVYFYSPTDLKTKQLGPDQFIRIGGIVKEDSVAKSENGLVTSFRVTDFQNEIAVRYRGVLPDLFRQGQGVVTAGKLAPDGVFVASEVLAKHDEKYMPPEVAEALKKSGRWQETGKAEGK